METRQGKIEEKFLKFAENKAPYATFTIDGLKYNTFDKDIIDAHNPDDFVEFTGEMKGKFWTMQTMKKIEEQPMREYAGPTTKPTAMPANGVKEYHLSPEEVKCRALECAIRYLPEDLTIDYLKEVADKFVEWIRNGN